MYLDLVSLRRSAEFSADGPEGRGGRRCSRLQVEQSRSSKADCLHSDTSKDILDLR